MQINLGDKNRLYTDAAGVLHFEGNTSSAARVLLDEHILPAINGETKPDTDAGFKRIHERIAAADEPEADEPETDDELEG